MSSLSFSVESKDEAFKQVLKNTFIFPDDLCSELVLKTKKDCKERVLELFGNFKSPEYAFNVINYLVETLIELITSVSYELDSKDLGCILRRMGSYQRTSLLLFLGSHTSKETWIGLFFSFWTSCDSCSVFYKEFNALLRRYDFSEIREQFFSQNDWEKYNALPDKITVFRGAFFESTEYGTSWSLSKKTANVFYITALDAANHGLAYLRVFASGGHESSFFKKYTEMLGSGACLCQTVVDKDKTLILFGRGESEVLVLEEDIKKIIILKSHEVDVCN